MRFKRNTHSRARRTAAPGAYLTPLLLLNVLLHGSPAARADGVVTNCSQAALAAALATGGNVAFTQNCTITLSSTITVTTNVTLDAAGRTVTVSGNNAARLFAVPSGISFTLKGLTLSGGQSLSGGALYIHTGAQVSITNCVLAGNNAAGASGVDGEDGRDDPNSGKPGGNGTAGSQAMGGAIYNLGVLRIFNCAFLTNRAAGGNGGNGGHGGDGSYLGGDGGSGGKGALGYGGAIFSLGTLWLTNCTFSGNTATGGNGGVGGDGGAAPFPGDVGRGAAGASGSGAAVYSAQGADFFACTFSGNAAQSGNSAAGGANASTGNGADGPRGPDSLGGAVYLQGSGALHNCTFSGNTTTGGNGGDGGNATSGSGYTGGNGGNGGNGAGGGLYNTGAVVVVNCTFSGCGAVAGAAGLAGGGPFPGSDGTPGHGRGGDVAHGSGSFSLQNSILAASAAGTNAYDTASSRISDGGFNISSDASLNLSGTSRKNTDPRVGSLASNGGSTQTIALQAGSPAIDAVPPGLCPPTDQRGVPRPQGTAADIGAYEVVTVPAIITQPQSQSIPSGSAVTFTVSVLGDGLVYQWRFNAAAIASATTTSYGLASVAQANAGTYDVIITNSYGILTSAPAILTVTFPPSIVSQPASLSVLRGSNATFSVQAAGLVPLDYQWRFNGTNLSTATASAWTVTNAQAANAGSYTVVITNNHGSITSAAAILTVNVPPYITTPPASQTVAAGSRAVLGVTAGGTEPLSYQWRFSGGNIADATASAYAIANAQATDAGSYAVVVANNYGSSTSPPAILNVVYDYVNYRSLAIARASNGVVQLAFTPAFTCQVETSTNLDCWQAVYATNNLSTNTPLLYFTDADATNLPLRFYRLVDDFAGPPLLTDWTLTNHSVSLSCVAPAVQTCRIEASSNLMNWATVFSTNLPAPAPFQFRFDDPANLAVRFYRLSQIPGF